MANAQSTLSRPWCPVCRQKVLTHGVYEPPNSFYEVFDDHGCEGDGHRVKDADYGYLREDEQVVPAWEF